MFALHWICALTLALASCLIAQPVKRDAEELLWHVLELNTTIIKLNCRDDIRLYSPVDISKDCMSSALNCTIRELKVLKSECSFPKEDFEAIDNVILGLNGMQTTKTFPTSSSPNCRCEMYDQKDVKTFLKNMKHQVQRLNSSK